MSKFNRVLVVEDELTNAILLKRILLREGYTVTVVNNGLDAKQLLERDTFDAVLTDWMMPQMDGIELIKFIRENIKPNPLVIMITALVSESAKIYALESGADDYIAKPIDVDEISIVLNDGLNRLLQVSEANKVTSHTTGEAKTLPPFAAVAIAASTGGPPTLLEVFRNIESNTKAVFFVVQHGPAWMLETFAQRLLKETGFNVQLASNFVTPVLGNVYLAPGDKHLSIDPISYKMLLDEGPKENFVRPAADPLFRSVAKAFGRYCVAVVLTGLGKDGSQGLTHIANAKGTIIIQDPSTAIAPSMPQAALNTVSNFRKIAAKNIGRAISEAVFPLAASIKINT